MPTVNQDYLCLITMNGGKTTFEKVSIPQSKELITILSEMVSNPNQTVLDLQSRMDLTFSPAKRGTINYVSPYGYKSSYISRTSYPESRSYEEYAVELEKAAESYREAFEKGNTDIKNEERTRFDEKKKQYIEEKVNEYSTRVKESYLSSAKRFIMASNYKLAVTAAKSRSDVRMYSTDTLGWSDFEYRVTDDVTITIGTNFGYGLSSYFHLGLRYKGIDILPYSFVVKYYYAKMDDIIRYTRLYDSVHESWNLAFEFVERMANKAAEDPHAFVTETIVDEVKEMVRELRVMLEPSNRFMERYINAIGTEGRNDYETVRNMDESERNQYRVYPEEMGMAVKAEKITGALAFLDNLTRLSETIPYIKEAVDEIIELTKALLPQMERMICRLSTEIESLESRQKEEEDKQEELRAKMAPYEEEIDRICESLRKDGNNTWRSDVEDEYGKKNKDYMTMKTEYSERSSLINKLFNEIIMRGSFKNQLEHCVSHAEAAGITVAA